MFSDLLLMENLPPVAVDSDCHDPDLDTKCHNMSHISLDHVGREENIYA